ncbi:MAG: site-2 protease family protein [Lentisphaeria bacterium]|nr:site-2 protease family protein [Lentisphaeria bacterium]
MLTVLDITAKILFVIFFFGLCIFIHELGHLLAGIWRGLYVEVFSIGFGKRLWGFKYKGVDYIVSMLPLGGYVKLPQLDPTDEPIASDDTPLPPTRPLNRAITAVAGPLANVVLGFFLAIFITIFGIHMPIPSESCDVIGVPVVLPLYKDGLEAGDVVDSIDGLPIPENESWWTICEQLPASERPIKLGVKRRGKNEGQTGEHLEIVYKPVLNPEYQAGLRPGDSIVAVSGHDFDQGWREMVEKILLNTDELKLTVRRDGKTRTVTYMPSKNPFYEGLGYPFFECREDVSAEAVILGTPAARAGFEAHDILVSINGEVVRHGGFFAQKVRESKGAPLTIVVKRDGEEITIRDVRAEEQTIKGEKVYLLGIKLGTPQYLGHPSPWRQFTDVVGRTWRTLGSLFAPVVGKRSNVGPKHLTGFIGIVPMMLTKVMTEGYIGGLSFVIIITFSLAFMNLLPLPVLDGGHIVYAVIEMVTGRKVPTKIVHWLQNAFAVLLISMLLYISFYDVLRLPRYWEVIKPRKGVKPPATAPATPGAEANGDRTPVEAPNADTE